MKKDKFYVFYNKSNKKIQAWTTNPEYAKEYYNTRNKSVLMKTHKLNMVDSEKFTLYNKNMEIQKLFSEEKELYVFTNDEVNEWYSTALGDILDIFQYPAYPLEEDLLSKIKSLEFIRGRKRFSELESIISEKINMPYVESLNNPYSEVYSEDMMIDYDNLIKYKSRSNYKT